MSHSSRKHTCVVRLLVDLQQRVDVLPTASGGDVFQRKVLSLDRPLAAVGVPETAIELRQPRAPLSDAQPLVEQVTVSCPVPRFGREHRLPGRSELPLILSNLIEEARWHLDFPSVTLLVCIRAPIHDALLSLKILPAKRSSWTSSSRRRATLGNKKLEEVLKSFKFRPGTTPDGTPIRMEAQIVYDFYRLRFLTMRSVVHWVAGAIAVCAVVARVGLAMASLQMIDPEMDPKDKLFLHFVRGAWRKRHFVGNGWRLHQLSWVCLPVEIAALILWGITGSP